MNNKVWLTTAIAVVIVVASCKKEGSKVETCDAGMGGNITLRATPVHRGLAPHHSTVVRPYAIWIAYNAKEEPKRLYDFYQKVDSTKAFTQISGLKCGDYFVFMNGLDTAVNEFVTGSASLNVPKEATGELTLTIPVTEH